MPIEWTATGEVVSPPPGNPDFTYWFDGQPLVGSVSGEDFSHWSDGKPDVQVGA